MNFPQSGPGPCGDFSGLNRFALILCILCTIGGCSSKHVETASAFPASIQETAGQPEELEDAEIQSARRREFDDLSLLSLDNDYFPTSIREDIGAFHSSDTSEEIESIPSISEIVLTQYKDWRGVRYRSGGADYRGVDCSGLVQAVFKDAFEMDLPRTSGEQAKLGEAVPRDEIQPGDLLYFIDRGRKHVGVAVNENEFLHASRKKGVVLSKFDKYWAPRLKHVRRLLDSNEPVVHRPDGG
jgi:cell wall-associated NlpC family hydrolase